MNRVAEVHRINWLIGLLAGDDTDGSDVLENCFALADGFKVLQGPVLGPLCAISSSLGIGFLGLLSLISPRLNGIIDAKQNVIAEDAED